MENTNTNTKQNGAEKSKADKIIAGLHFFIISRDPEVSDAYLDKRALSSLAEAVSLLTSKNSTYRELAKETIRDWVKLGSEVRRLVKRSMDTSNEEPPFTCKYCGLPSWIDPSDQSPSPDYCHKIDHGTPEDRKLRNE